MSSVNNNTSSEQPNLKYSQWASNGVKLGAAGVCLTTVLCALNPKSARVVTTLDRVAPKVGGVSLALLFASGMAKVGLTPPPKNSWGRPRF